MNDGNTPTRNFGLAARQRREYIWFCTERSLQNEVRIA